MSRRKVTMLEAFQASAKDAAERAATERRRLIAEREKEIRREEAARTAGDLRGRMSARLGLSGRRPAEEPEDASWAPPVPLDVAVVPATEDSPADVPALEAAQQRTTADATPELTAVGRVLDPDTLEEASALEETLFTLPMSARTFSVLQALLLASVFFVGWSVGGAGDATPGNEASTARAAGRNAGPGAGPSIDSLGNRAGMGRKPVNSKSGKASSAPSAPAMSNAAPPVTGGLNTVDDDYTAADRLFQSPGMKYTVLAFTCPNTTEDADKAWDTYDVLRAEGLPAVRPIQRGDRIFVFVGASAKLAELRGTEKRLHELRSRTGKHVFRGAYPVSIDRYK